MLLMFTGIERIEVQREITKQKQSKHGPLKRIEVGSGTMEE